MKAIVFEKHGGPEVLQYVNATEPTIKANEVLVEVRACALNHLDVWARRGLPGIDIPLPHILGNDIAGIVRETGDLVTWVSAGDEVMLQPGTS
jgi:NADPH:quinone reductase-like Zn-dependent oxidoreductase